MKSVVLRLEGPFQAWSSQGKFGIRDTEREPTKSGVIGLLAAALGMACDDDALLAQLATLSMAVRVDRAGSLLRDFHTAGGGKFRGEEYVVFGASDCVPSHRYYLTDASFVVALSGEDSFIERIARALENPRWPLFLGRRSCALTSRALLGVVPEDAAEAVRRAPDPEGRDRHTTDEGPRRIVVESSAGQGAEVRYDVPRSFAEGRRSYGQRYVRTEWWPNHNQASGEASP